MKKALISPLEPRNGGYRVAQVEPAGSEFPIGEPFFWVDCADDVVADQFYYDTTTQSIVPNPVPVPTEVTMRQARLALLAANLLDAANAAVAGMTGDAGKAAQIDWEYATSVNRHNGLVTQMGAALGLTDAQIDALFVAAAAIK